MNIIKYYLFILISLYSLKTVCSNNSLESKETVDKQLLENEIELRKQKKFFASMALGALGFAAGKLITRYLSQSQNQSQSFIKNLFSRDNIVGLLSAGTIGYLFNTQNEDPMQKAIFWTNMKNIIIFGSNNNFESLCLYITTDPHRDNLFRTCFGFLAWKLELTFAATEKKFRGANEEHLKKSHQVMIAYLVREEQNDAFLEKITTPGLTFEQMLELSEDQTLMVEEPIRINANSCFYLLPIESTITNNLSDKYIDTALLHTKKYTFSVEEIRERNIAKFIPEDSSFNMKSRKIINGVYSTLYFFEQP